MTGVVLGCPWMSNDLQECPGFPEFHATYYNLAFTEEQHIIIYGKSKENTGMHVCMHFFVFVIKSIH